MRKWMAKMFLVKLKLICFSSARVMVDAREGIFLPGLVLRENPYWRKGKRLPGKIRGICTRVSHPQGFNLARYDVLHRVESPIVSLLGVDELLSIDRV